ncbi:hypothetical protein [Phytohabitans flavus]|uniref:hypothetical protein n=1 Tax=Phytohabitans flavus TaxID=1076124 RepID=UPI0031EA2163
MGSVWSAIDPQGRSLMVALLDPNVATDQRWREAFQEAANALVQAGEPGYLYADFASGSPWVAYAAENGVGAERVFLALGMDFQPVPPDGLGPMDYTPVEPTTQLTTPPQAPDTAAQQQPLPPDVIEASTPAEAPPTTVFPPVQPGPPATESAQPVAAQHSPAPAPVVPQPAPAPAPVEQADESNQPTHAIQLPPMTPPPVAPWPSTAAPQPAPPVPPQPQSAPVPPISSAPPHPASGAPYPVSGAPHPVSGAPHPISGAPHPTSGAPRPVSGTPMSPAFSQPLSPVYGAPAYGPRPPQGPAPYDPYAPVAPPQPRRSRSGLWIGIAVAVLVLIAGGGGVYAWQASGDTPTTPEGTNAATEAPLPTATPLRPGIEPPQDGNWDTKWPRFIDPPDKVREVNPDGVGFKFLVPRDWDCQLSGSGQGFVKYNCGPTPGGSVEIGGELVVRECPDPCDDARRLAMRKAEEAWGLRWKRGSRLSSYAEANDIDGEARYGLVIVAYSRSAPDSAVNRQIVFRMTAPVEQADVIRKISRSVRTSALF